MLYYIYYRLMPFVQIIGVFSETRTEKLNTACGENTQLFSVTTGGLCTKQKMHDIRKMSFYVIEKTLSLMFS